MQQLLSESKIKDIQGLITSARLSHNYSDIMYSIRCSRTILIEALSFWGPFEKEKSNFNVKVVFTQFEGKFPPERENDEVVIDKFETFAEAKNSEMFVVQCPREVRVEKGKWFRIRFQLNGSDTCVCTSISNNYYLNNCDTEFEFFDSSHQIPEIQFRIVE
ncbi:unnamed protein product [Allacma fusca]|uniref:Uncharacterized protein n=1 Tax=Allacma fusca TaxID=39272 RepID=A0A8J2JR55_9HEXA|nr:unnamed protein product [Allacma fusca]